MWEAASLQQPMAEFFSGMQAFGCACLILSLDKAACFPIPVPMSILSGTDARGSIENCKSATLLKIVRRATIAPAARNSMGGKMVMILRSVGPSPFGRKVRIATAVLGLNDEITIKAADTMNPDDSIRGQNPLGKIPALILNDGRVIIEYLDKIAGGGRLIPNETDARFEALTLATLADGILDAGILIVYEGRYRPD